MMMMNQVVAVERRMPIIADIAAILVAIIK